MEPRPYLRHLWSHQHVLHRKLVQIANRVLRRLPDGPKYALGRRLRSRRPPYCFVRPGDVVLQVGAPQDTLLAGRSRAAHFSLLVGPHGRVLVIEPDPASVEQLQRWLRDRRLRHVSTVAAGAWSTPGELRVFVDEKHPATNFTEGTTEYSEARLAEFRPVTVPATTVDDVVKEHALARVDLVSITTNGAEIEILAGAALTIEHDHPMICLARTREQNIQKMAELGYAIVTADDRGYTFVWSHA